MAARMESSEHHPVLGFNEQGIFQIDIATDALDPTGQERHELRIPGVTKPIGSARPFVEAFEPVRLKLESSVPPLVEKGTLDVAVKVSTLFGGVAADLPVRARGQFNPRVSPPLGSQTTASIGHRHT